MKCKNCGHDIVKPDEETDSSCWVHAEVINSKVDLLKLFAEGKLEDYYYGYCGCKVQMSEIQINKGKERMEIDYICGCTNPEPTSAKGRVEK